VASYVAERAWRSRKPISVYVMPDGAVMFAPLGSRSERAIARVYAVICIGVYARGATLAHLADEITAARAECLCAGGRA
jgi:lipopolysaccharide export LptBFGC system permease protein LptF